jgi:hypothetical protein
VTRLISRSGAARWVNGGRQGNEGGVMVSEWLRCFQDADWYGMRMVGQEAQC